MNNETKSKNYLKLLNVLLRIEKKLDTIIESKLIEKEDIEPIFTLYTQEEEPSPKSKKHSTYKTLKKCITMAEELTPEDKTNKIKQINESIKQPVILDLSDYKKIFSECFDQIKINRFYSKSMEEIKKTKLKIIDLIPYSEYEKLLRDHVTILENIFKEKDYSDKKILNTIPKSMSALDMRILQYSNYINTELEMDDIQKLKKSLSIFNASPEFYTKFVSIDFFKKFFNYGSVIFSLKESIELYLFNTYDFNNVIYTPLKQSTEKDPYSFYILESIKQKKRYWKMDCRLEDLSNNFIYNIKPYLIKLFRKIYFDVFHDNLYRQDYKTTNVITEYDCEQLLRNIYLMANQKQFCCFLRNIVIEKATYIPTENDKFNIYGDDILQKRRLAGIKEKEISDDYINLTKLLFDGISIEEAVDFKNQYCC